MSTYNINFKLDNIQIINSDESSSLENANSYSKKPKLTYLIEPAGAKFDEAKRVIAIVYSYNNDIIMYGASIFRKINKNDLCVKSQIRQTAYERFYSYPVIFSIKDKLFQNEKLETDINNHKLNIKWKDVIKSIRLQMYTQGVKSKDKNNAYNSVLLQSGILETGSQDSNSQSDSKNKIREPRVSYLLEPYGCDWNTANRIIAIAYSYDKNSISYGASIFRRTYPNEVCTKADIRSTALERFNQAPIILYNNLTNTFKQEDLNQELIEEFNQESNPMIMVRVNEVLRFIRSMMYKHGVKNKSKVNDSTTNVYNEIESNF